MSGKIIYLYAFLLGMVLAAGCSKKEDMPDAGDQSMVFHAAMESGGTRTVLGNGDSETDSHPVLWTPGDCIWVSTASASGKYVYNGSENTEYADFGGSLLTGSMYYSLYPYGTARMRDGILSFEMPSVQYYSPLSFGPEASPMVARSTGTDLYFQNLCGLLKLNLIGDASITSISFRAEDTYGNKIKVSGPAVVDMDYTSEPVLVMDTDTDAGTTVTLDCGNGVMLDPTAGTSFYIALPPGTYDVFTLIITDSNGDTMEQQGRSLTINRSRVKPTADLLFKGSQEGNPDREALMAFYNATDGPNWNDNTNWGTDEPLDTWYGITTGYDGRVTSIELSDNGLSGNAGNTLAPLTYMQTLACDHNCLTGLDLRGNQNLGESVNIGMQMDQNYEYTSLVVFLTDLQMESWDNIWSGSGSNGYVVALSYSVPIYTFNEYLNLPAEGGEFTLDVAFMEEDYIVSALPSWIHENGRSTNGNIDTYLFSADDNSTLGNLPRSGAIGFSTSDGRYTCQATIQQKGGIYESTDYSADGTVVTLQTATVGNGIDIVLMGDAYSDRLIADGTYRSVMENTMEQFFSEEPYSSFRDYFNVYMVNVVSPNEGYVTGGVTALETYFGEGTSVGGNDQKAMDYALGAIDASRMDEALIVVMMNRDYYAGTCWMYFPSEGDYGNGLSIAYFPTSSDTETFRGLILHEAGGHGFTKLADEYAYEAMGEIPSTEITNCQTLWEFGWYKNIDFTSSPEHVNWTVFLSDGRYQYDGLGVFEGGFTYWTGVWRPTENSIMRHNTGGFNAPSRECIYIRIHKLAYGESWQYDYEEFVEYDAVNRRTGPASEPLFLRRYEPTAPPVIIPHTWREARQNQ